MISIIGFDEIKGMTTNKSRIPWLDFARALAIISVVLCHSVEAIYTYDMAFRATLSVQTNVFAVTAFTFGRLGVPLFLFISGYLLLDRDWDKQACHKFWKTRWLPLFLCVEAWIVIYYLFLVATTGRPFQLENLICEMLFVKKVAMGHFWYMPMIVGFYLFLPVMGAALKKLDPWTVAFPLTAVALCCFVVPIARQIFAVSSIPIELAPQINVGFAGGIYGVYLILGWCAKREAFNKIPVTALTCSTVALFVACIAFQYICHQHGVAYHIWYDNGMIMLCGLSLFVLISRMPTSWFEYVSTQVKQSIDTPPGKYTLLQRISFSLSYYSFAIYLTHYPIRMLLTPPFKQLAIAMPLQTIALCFFTLIISLATCWLIAKIPWVGKKLLFLK